MSRIGRMPIVLPKEVKISCDLSRVEVTGPKGHLLHPLPQGISISVDEGKVLVQRADDQRTSRALARSDPKSHRQYGHRSHPWV